MSLTALPAGVEWFLMVIILVGIAAWAAHQFVVLNLRIDAFERETKRQRRQRVDVWEYDNDDDFTSSENKSKKG